MEPGACLGNSGEILGDMPSPGSSEKKNVDSVHGVCSMGFSVKCIY